MGVSLGDVGPVHDRWIWPFARMEIGDWFHVAHDRRHPEKVRTLAYTAMKRLGFHAAVTANDRSRPGYCKVERVALPGGRRRTENEDGVVPWGVVQKRFRQSYERVLDDEFGQQFDRQFVKAPQLLPTPRRCLISQLAGDDRIRRSFEFREDGIMIEKVPPSIGSEEWLARYGVK